MSRKRYTEAEQTEAADQLRALLPPGTIVHTILRHVSRSGMLRRIDPLIVVDGDFRYLTYSACVVLDEPPQYAGDGIRMGGAGMDMGFSLVYDLSRRLYHDGFTCAGESCHSNDHSNGDRDRTPHQHTDGGYALRQRWL